MERRLLSVEEAAKFLSLSPRTLYNGSCRSSRAPFPVKPKRYGRRVLFDIRDLEAFADSLPYDREQEEPDNALDPHSSDNR